MDAGCEWNRSGVAESCAVFLVPVRFRSEKGGVNHFRSTGGQKWNVRKTQKDKKQQKSNF